MEYYSFLCNQHGNMQFQQCGGVSTITSQKPCYATFLLLSFMLGMIICNPPTHMCTYSMWVSCKSEFMANLYLLAPTMLFEMCHCMPLLPLQPCSLMNLNIHFQRIYAYILTTSFSYPFFAFISNVGLLFLTIMPCPPPSPQIIVGLSVISNNTSNLVWKINLSNCYTWHMPMTYS